MNASTDADTRRTGRRSWLFAVWIITTAVVAAAGVLMWRYQRMAIRMSARAMARSYFVELHWQNLESVSEFRSVIKDISEGLERPGSAEWSAKFVAVAWRPPSTLDAFESQALAEMQAGGDELWDSQLTVPFRYAMAIRANYNSCFACHPKTLTGATTAQDLLAVLIVQSPGPLEQLGFAVAQNRR